MVGIEPNPGPPNPLGIIKAFTKGIKVVKSAAKAASLPAQIIMQTVAPKKKRKSNIKQTSFMKNEKITRSPSLSLNKLQVVTQRFNSQLIYVRARNASSGGLTAVNFSDGVNVTGYGGLFLNPQTAGLSPGCCGLALSDLALIFAEFRLIDYTIKFVPVLGSMYNGTIALGFLDDVVTTYPDALQGAANADDAIVTPITQTASVSANDVIKTNAQNWYYCKLSGATPTEKRQSSPGILIGFVAGYQNTFSGSSVLADAALLGTLEVSGTIQFRGLRPKNGFEAAQAVSEPYPHEEEKFLDITPEPTPQNLYYPKQLTFQKK